MNSEWSLEVLYKGFDDPKFAQDLKALEEKLAAYKDAAAKLGGMEPREGLECILKLKEEYMLTAKRLLSFSSLTKSANTADGQAANYLEQLDMALSDVSRENAMLKKYIAGIEDLDKVIDSSEFLKQYRFMLHETKQAAAHSLSDDVEDVLAKMDISGGSAWANLQEYLTSSVEVEYQGKTITLSDVRNLAFSPDKEVRKAAYEAELMAYDKIKDPVAFALNSIKAQVNTESDLRGYASPLEMTLEDSRMKRETLDAMFQAMEEYLPKFHEYLKVKAKRLGYEHGLPWYEVRTPMGESRKQFTTEEAKEYLIAHFRPFAEDLAEMVERAFDEAWIDFYPRKGKVGGAFCSNMPYLGQSRVLTNFSGSMGSVVTLAHELGHAYHGQQLQDHRPLNTSYTMPVAETASTFNENVILQAAIAETEGEERLALLESQLQGTTQIICDIYSRYLFETAVFENRRNSFMFADELCNIMLEAQKKAYGDGLDHDALHPYMWVCKGHYYSTGRSFYNFPYAFGGLFAGGLYAKYLEEGQDFVPKYREMLKATTVSTVEDVAAMAGIDITKPDFWRKSLKLVADQIDMFVRG